MTSYFFTVTHFCGFKKRKTLVTNNLCNKVSKAKLIDEENERKRAISQTLPNRRLS
jgi:hypothetical protein